MKFLNLSAIVLLTFFSISCGSSQPQKEITTTSNTVEDSSTSKSSENKDTTTVTAAPINKMLPSKFNGEYTDECELDSYRNIRIKTKNNESTISVRFDSYSSGFCSIDSVQENGKTYTCYFKEKEKDKNIIVELTYLDKGVIKGKLLAPKKERRSFNFFNCEIASEKAIEKYFN